MKLPGKRAKDAASRNAGARGADAQAQSEETLRVRARRRLIGAVALVLTGVVVFPLIFETQPKPVASNMNLVIPPQSTPQAMPRAGASQPLPRVASAASAAASALGTPPASAPAQPAPAQAAQAQPAPAPAAQPQAAAEAKAPAHPAARPASAPHPLSAGARQALAALDGQSATGGTAAKAAAASRFVVQAGAYADAQTAHQVRMKIEHAGMKTYAQVVDTKAGKRIRVRVGPFARREQADQAAAHIRALGVSAAVLTL